jgi:methionyl-tRNA formyltransferase
MNIVFMGTADFGIPTLTRIEASHHRLQAVVSTPARARGRGRRMQEVPIVSFCTQRGIGPVYTPAHLDTPELASTLSGLQPDVFVVVAFRILPSRIFTIPDKGTFNIHASLLPKYRGAAPVQRAIEHGESHTGITVFKIDRGIDTGGIILQKETPIAETDTTPSLFERLAQLGAEACMEALDTIERDTYTIRTQEPGGATHAPKLRKCESHIDWTLPAQTIYNKIRAFKPFPGTYTLLHGTRLGIEWAQPVADDTLTSAPGRITHIDHTSFTVSCGKDALRITQVKPEGKRAMSCEDFLHGSTLTTEMVLQ